MEYIYDIVLNFQDKYYDFYEWYRQDKILNIKKIPIYKITHKDYLNIKQNDIRIDKISLPKSNKMFLLTSGFEVMGVLLDDTYRVTKKSSLIFEESDDILSDIGEVKSINIKYNILRKYPITYESRVHTEQYNFVINYLNNLNKEKDKYLLKYLYFDIYNKEEDSLDIIYDKLVSLSKENLPLIYEAISKLQ